MTNDLFGAKKKSDGRIEGSSFKRIPSISKLVVIQNRVNPITLDTGFDRKYKPQLKVTKFISQNSANRYMAFKIRFLRELLKKDLHPIFWDAVAREMKYSTSFRVSAFNAVMKGWYKNLDFQRVVQINFGVQKIIEQNLCDIKYFRIEIPKGDSKEIEKWMKENPEKKWPGKTRPLGVPTASWRVVLHMWNAFLAISLEEELKSFNHAYLPKRGTLTAIQELITKVRHLPFIYEFDIKGFFDNVDIFSITQALKKRGMSARHRNILEKMLLSTPANIPTEVDEPPSEDLPYDKLLGIRRNIQMYDKWTDVFLGLVSSLERKPSTLRNSIWAKFVRWGYPLLKRYFKIPYWVEIWLVMNRYIEERKSTKIYSGLPQGAAPSTTLSLLALSDWAKDLKAKGIGLLMYADDGLLYSNKAFHPSAPPPFKFAPEKSRWVKLYNILQVPELKFLGITYNFQTGLIRASTRSGSSLEFGPEQFNFLDTLKDLAPFGSSADRMQVLAKSNILGVALSKLYSGQWSETSYLEDTLYSSSSYWAKYHDLDLLRKSKLEERTASTVACGWLLRLNKHVMHKTSKTEFAKEVVKYHTERPWASSQTNTKNKAAYGLD